MYTLYMKNKYTTDKWHVNFHTPIEWKEKVQGYATNSVLTKLVLMLIKPCW